MRVVITGAAGQLGQALVQSFGAEHEVVALSHADIDLAKPECVEQLAATRADLVLHPAAMTNVDGCARDPDAAYRVNGLGTRYVALACRRMDAALLYVSTNEVFDGAGGVAYREYDQAGPINAYGRSKWIGEQAVRELVAQHYIVRVAWLFGGERNFVRTVLRLGAERGVLSMVTDEIGSPTFAPDVAMAAVQLVQQPLYGTYHLVNSGSCSRYDFAQHALRLAGRSDVVLTPMLLADYRRDSRVPLHTPLRNIAAADLGIVLRPWEAALEEYIERLVASG
jgi:dTDP-4-dehydrorhamnose reductase